MGKYYFKLGLLLLAVLPYRVKGQDGLPLTVAIFNEATAIPFTGFFSKPVHPGVQLGTEFHWKESKHFRLYPRINIGYMFHQNLFQGVYGNLELGIDYKFNFGLNVKTALGVGYLHTFSTRQEYQFKNGRYQAGADKGNSRVMPSLSLGLGYNLKPHSHTSTEVFVLYQSWIEYPYSPGFIPVMSHTNLQIGSKFYPFKRAKQ